VSVSLFWAVRYVAGRVERGEVNVEGGLGRKFEALEEDFEAEGLDPLVSTHTATHTTHHTHTTHTIHALLASTAQSYPSLPRELPRSLHTLSTAPPHPAHVPTAPIA